jgi:hypothetical protein
MSLPELTNRGVSFIEETKWAVVLQGYEDILSRR